MTIQPNEQTARNFADHLLLMPPEAASATLDDVLLGIEGYLLIEHGMCHVCRAAFLTRFAAIVTDRLRSYRPTLH